MLEAVHLHPPLMPGMSALLRRLPVGEPSDAVQASRRALGWFAVRARVALPMQSAAREAAAASVSGPSATVPPPASAPPSSAPDEACAGLWCIEHGRPPPDAGQPAMPAPDATPAPPRAPPDAGEACGVILCCAP
ncbi:hypothetical protein FOZ76_24075 [Verticiella sediminum]|uniref:Uncharacterized protein n=1 Tax=Verticiella sediminum TaxID=1247510 RepID=A0A556A970_9BURK|nr:hypothetical protein FOZ76_24075 [Verticiella sediminum]